MLRHDVSLISSIRTDHAPRHHVRAEQHSDIMGHDFKDDLRPALLGTGCALLGLCYATVAARFYSRYTLHCISGDDWLILLALMGFSLIVHIHHHTAENGEIGLHANETDFIHANEPPHPVKDKILVLLCVLAYHFTTTCIRISVCLFLDRINPAYEIFRRLVYSAIILNILFFLSTLAGILATCGTVDISFWAPNWSAQPGAEQCRLARRVTQFLPIMLDVLVWVLPIVIVKKVRRKMREKLLLAVVMCFGFGACIACATRIPFTRRAINSDDTGWNHAKSQLMVVIEICVGIVAASAPAMPALCAMTKRKLRLLSSGRHRDPELEVARDYDNSRPSQTATPDPLCPPTRKQDIELDEDIV